MIEQTKRLICEINRIHRVFSTDYFDTGEIEKINLGRTLAHIPKSYIYQYRLYLHESINDYLMSADLGGIRYYYRVKTRESIDDKLERFARKSDQYPVNNWLNDIFGARMVLCGEDIAQILGMLDDWQTTFGLKNWYVRDKDGYKGIHIYFKNKSNFFFPWELQLWDTNDMEENIRFHRLYKRDFIKEYRTIDN